ncbi:sigma-70 family RNA polymerase sigma factor [Dactylosporangium aurantiacum]|uniref:Sigma-70 family RNA polymerase sigma factor n=1 Tax=Dactylosporangium aurantiacum TaxID=35754 RepID=A0A9Q9IQV7_9ACTN|nr:sigma-70 family RNA polymerase sigma factor [Dactylosporangium aurantiacum]MDG6103334.1 sigma-70 family RNA polymerase sigma factor [Dactylosporangium aurantiacum]UWZ59941.1 sigma-70 family RNA polymerase sigma factor [Dactylosporangium aurantiacum]
MLAATVRVARDLDLAEECVQDAYVAAMDAWLRQGVPANPGAWLTVAAQRRAINAHKRAATLRSKLPLLVVPDAEEPEEPEEPDEIPDDRLRLVFTCCHPALAREAQLAITLRLVCGLTTAEIARAFLVSEPTMAARVTRAKKKIAAAAIPYRVPPLEDLPDRLDAVLTVVHLVFTTGHAAPTGPELLRPDLVERALDLARTLCALMPDEREAQGLLALMLLHDARRATRVAADGRLLLLEEQDRTRWDAAQIAEGLRLVRACLRGGRPGRFALQAAIAAVYTEAPTYADTDWHQLRGLYDLLLAAWPSPVVALNRAVVVAMADGPAAALPLLDALAEDPRLVAYHYLPAARADLLRRLGRHAEAEDAYRAAIALCDNAVERAFLHSRLDGSGARP